MPPVPAPRTLGLLAAVFCAMLSAPVATPPAGAATVGTTDPTPLPHAHSHNDYLQPRPLLDALDHGFTSVEADVWLQAGKLCLGHAVPDCSRDLETTYLKPLQVRADARGGSVYAGWSGRFQLLIELKSDGATTWPAVEQTLARYPGLITHWSAGRRTDGPVAAVITGNRPKTAMAAAPQRWSALDGDLADIGRYDADLMPLVSASWWTEFTWRGGYPMPSAQRDKLRRLVAAAHAHGHAIRFYATPELNDPVSAWRRRNVWDAETAAGVDWLNTDNLGVLEDYLRSRR